MKPIGTMLMTLCVILLCVVTASASSEITSITFSNSGATAEENLSLSGYGDKDGGYAASTLGGRIYASVSGTDLRKLEWSKGEYGTLGMQPVMTGGTKNPWGSGAYLEIRTSTVGYENITFSAQIGATNKGPCDYKLQYSIDGVNFKDVGGAFFSVTTNKTMLRAFDNVALPADAGNVQELCVRITVASNRMVNGTAGLIGSTGGETAINFVTVSGDPLTTAETTATATEATDNKAQPTATEAAVTTTVTETVVTNVATGEESIAWLCATALGALLVVSITAKRRKHHT